MHSFYISWLFTLWYVNSKMLYTCVMLGLMDGDIVVISLTGGNCTVIPGDVYLRKLAFEHIGDTRVNVILREQGVNP